ncbi:cation diffusion facilitator family transporter [Halalkalibacter nanhaiisediminis]|uniref:Cation diffusion facilitator family transporter n=1 Tax=Halalkalibacter nanhaiisediminis TaxID=688079 RepID=A0A562QTW5_9BACI|nr:cation diffusion facilitator family transporter [Halalkalibacter nanhaiisediminis]TWI59680.1 cation diffusion facilitator family transporter [Halalkalibacter nanhaiisediminis]
MSEKQILTLSVYGALLFALTGVVWGVAIESKMILFDGAYSFVSVGLSLLSLSGAAYIQKQDEKRFPFGKEVIEPIIIIVKAIVILLLCLSAIVSAVYDLANGGSNVQPGYALGYAVFSTVGCFVVVIFLSRQSGKKQSGFVEAEKKQWLMDTLLSGAVLVGFLIATVLTYTNYAGVVVYIDPAMVLLVSIYCLKMPLTMLRASLREVLEMSPAPAIQSRITNLVKQIESKYKFKESMIRTSKVGEKLYIEIDFILDTKSGAQTVAEHDTIREEIATKIDDLQYTKWLTISFTQNRKWA